MSEDLADLCDYAWIIICNVSGGNWEAETKEWQKAAEKFRTRYHAALRSGQIKPEGEGADE